MNSRTVTIIGAMLLLSAGVWFFTRTETAPPPAPAPVTEAETPMDKWAERKAGYPETVEAPPEFIEAPLEDPTPPVDVPDAEPLPTSDLPWAAVISENLVVACRDGDEYLSGDDCPDEVFAVRVENNLEAPVALTFGPVVLTQAPNEACPNFKVPKVEPSDTAESGRVGRRLAPADPSVKEWIDELRGEEGLKVADLRAFDFDGDGRDEYVFELDSHPNWPFLKGPLEPTSFLGMRRVAEDGTATIVEIHRDRGSLAPGEVSPNSYSKGSFMGVTDIDGDGAMELVAAIGKPFDMSYAIFAIVGDTATRLAGVRCTW